MEDTLLIVYGFTYDFEDEKSKKRIVGGKLVAITNSVVNDSDKHGSNPITFNADKSIVENLLPNIPCICNVKYSMVADSKGKATLQPTSFSPVKNIDLGNLFK